MVNITDYVLCLPLILLALFAAGCLVMDRMFPPEWKWLNAVTALVGIIFSSGGVAKIQFTQAQLALSGIRLEVGFHHAIVIDSFAFFFYYLILAAGALSVLIMMRQTPPEHAPRGLFYAAIMCALMGLMCMVSGFHLGLIFAGVVVSEAAGYLLVRTLCKEEPGRSACRRYMVWKAFSCGLLGVGFWLLRWKTGSAGLHEVRQAATKVIAGETADSHHMIMAGFALIAAGVILRIAAIPFHQWNRGADEQVQNFTQPLQNGVTGLLSTAFPVAAWAMAMHIFLWGFYPLRFNYSPWLVWAGIALLTVGTLAILLQSDLRRLVAYATLTTAGFMLLALAVLAASDPFSPNVTNGLKAVIVYLPAIVAMNLGALAAITLLRRQGIGGEIADLRGAFGRASLLCGLLLISLLSILGIPPLAGFYGRYFAYLSVSGSGHRMLAGFGIAYALLGALCMVRILKAMFSHAGSGGSAISVRSGISGADAAVFVCTAVTVVAGVHPQFLIQLANWAMHLT